MKIKRNNLIRLINEYLELEEKDAKVQILSEENICGDDVDDDGDGFIDAEDPNCWNTYAEYYALNKEKEDKHMESDLAITRYPQNKETYWNFPILHDKEGKPLPAKDQPMPSDWDISNFDPIDIMSKGNKRVVAKKSALRGLDTAAGRITVYGHPEIKLTNQDGRTNRNGGYRDPKWNKSDIVKGAKSSRHKYGDGYDIWTQGWTREERLGLFKNFWDLGFRGFGHGVNNVHVDNGRSKLKQWPYPNWSVQFSKKDYIA